jgi:hypothetical protein
MRFQVPFAFGVPTIRDTFNNLRSDAVYMQSIKKILESKLKNNNKLADDNVSILQKFNTNKPIVTILDLISSQIKSEINSLHIWDDQVDQHIPFFQGAIHYSLLI